MATINVTTIALSIDTTKEEKLTKGTFLLHLIQRLLRLSKPSWLLPGSQELSLPTTKANTVNVEKIHMS